MTIHDENAQIDYQAKIVALLDAFEAASWRDLDRAQLRWRGHKLEDVVTPEALNLETALRGAERVTGWRRG